MVVVVGDFEPTQAKEWVQQYFGNIPAGTIPETPDLTEPVQEEEQRFSKDDKLAKKPALGFDYQMP